VLSPHPASQATPLIIIDPTVVTKMLTPHAHSESVSTISKMRSLWLCAASCAGFDFIIPVSSSNTSSRQAPTGTFINPPHAAEYYGIVIPAGRALHYYNGEEYSRPYASYLDGPE
jgi:hypothetical protein